MDKETLSVYASKASDYAAHFVTEKPSAILQTFIDGLPKGGHALDLGCGPGNSAAGMRNAGLQVTATDASPEMAVIAKEQYDIEVKVQTFDDISGEDLYDGVWANFCLLHAPKADMPRHLKALHKAMKPKGRLHIGLKVGDGEARDKLGRFYSYYQEAELLNLLKEAGFSPEQPIFGEEVGLSGSLDPWIMVTAYA